MERLLAMRVAEAWRAQPFLLSNATPQHDRVLLFASIREMGHPLSERIHPTTLPSMLDATLPKAEELFIRLWPEAADRFRWFMRIFYPLTDIRRTSKDDWGCVCGHDWDKEPWSCHVTIDAYKGLVEGWVHEMAHNWLHYLGVHLLDWTNEFLLNDKTEKFPSPARRDITRPMGAVLQGTYSYIHVCEWEWRCWKDGDKTVTSQLAFNLGRMEEALEVIPPNIKATKLGMLFWLECEEWIQKLLRDTRESGILPIRSWSSAHSRVD